MVAPRLASWPYLGPTWSELGTNLGPTWGQLGSTWCHLGANLVPNELQLVQNDLQICARYTVMIFMLVFGCFFDTENNGFVLLFWFELELIQQVKIIKKHSKYYGFWRFFICWAVFNLIKRLSKIILENSKKVVSIFGSNFHWKITQNYWKINEISLENR